MAVDLSACKNKEADTILINSCNGDFTDIFQICWKSFDFKGEFTWRPTRISVRISNVTCRIITRAKIIFNRIRREQFPPVQCKLSINIAVFGADKQKGTIVLKLIAKA